MQLLMDNRNRHLHISNSKGDTIMCINKDELSNRVAEIRNLKELSQLSKRYGRNVYSVWSDKPAIKKFVYLCITYCAGDSVKHYIIMGFEDAENNCLTAECKLAVVPLSCMRKIKERIISRIYNHFI